VDSRAVNTLTHRYCLGLFSFAGLGAAATELTAFDHRLVLRAARAI